jgi:NAD(P)-dependent dehydrogenase (short-subunit alcohol dehydrogenase family)
LSQQTWESFSSNWHTDVQHVFQFIREALLQPLDSGSTVISLSSGAAMRGSPLSGGYAGAKAMIRFVSSYAAMEAQQNSLGIRFVALLPQITPGTDLGAPFVAAYARSSGISQEEYLAQFGTTLSVDQVASNIVDIASNNEHCAPAYLLSGNGMRPLE